MKVYPVFLADKLRKAATNPLPGQQEDLPGPIIINKQEE